MFSSQKVLRLKPDQPDRLLRPCIQLPFHQIVYMPHSTATDVGCTKRNKIKYIAVFLELCTDLARSMKAVHVVRLVGKLQR